MINLEELKLLLSVIRIGSTYIDGIQLHDEILIYMPRLNKFIFNLDTYVDHNNIQIDFSSNAKRLKMSTASNQVIDDSTMHLLNSADLGQSTNLISVKMTAADGQTAHGNLKFIQMGNTLIISGEVSGLTPGAHGFHIHEHGNCEDCHEGFTAEGGHYNPTHVMHGSLENGHVGDLGNIYADKNGNAKIFLKIQKININDDENEFSVLHRTVMIHANEDDLKTDPAGNSGVRILCGVIQK